MVILGKGELTQKAEDVLFGLPEDEDQAVKIGLEYWFCKDNFSNFSDGLTNLAISAGYCGHSEDKTEVCRYILDVAKNSDVPLLAQKRNIQNWLRESNPPSRTKDGRDVIFRICFALNLSLAAVENFFRKVYWERPFNFRDLKECIYYYCFKNGLSYSDAERILSKVELQKNETAQADHTALIRQNVELSDSDEDIVRYLAGHYSSFGVNAQTAINRISMLLQSCKQTVDELYEREPGKFEIYGMKNHITPADEPTDSALGADLKGNEKLLNIIYGIPSRTFEGGKYVKKSCDNDIKKSFPLKYAQSNIPSVAQLKSILSGTIKEADGIRKALILLDFYQFAAQVELGVERDENDFYGDFESEVNQILAECGFAEIYLRNPYDWLFYYCASRDNPLSSLQEMLSPVNRSDGEDFE